MIKIYRMKMKSIMLFFLLNVLFLYGQTIRVTPKEVYVGDEAEIRFSFDWDGEILAENAEDFSSLITSTTIDESLENNYTIKSMQIFRSQGGYELSIVFIPWKAGLLNLDPFDLATLFELNVNTLLIDIPEIEIQSILTQVQEKEIRAPVGPIIIPGTTYVLVVITILAFVLLLGVILVLVRLKFIKAWIKSFLGKIWASDNFKKASKELMYLSKYAETIQPKEFAARLSVAIRTYLEGRFGHRFTAETTSNFFGIFDVLFAGTVSVRASEYLQDLYEVCARCDFLHYAGSEADKSPLTQEETQTLINKTRHAIIYFEKDSDTEDEKGGYS